MSTSMQVGDHAAVEHGDAVGQQHGLFHVVRDEHDREAALAPEGADQRLHAQAGEGVKRTERLVEQQHGRVARQRAGEGHALGLASRERVGPGVGVGLEPDLGQRPDRAGAALGCAIP